MTASSEPLTSATNPRDLEIELPPPGNLADAVACSANGGQPFPAEWAEQRAEYFG